MKYSLFDGQLMDRFKFVHETFASFPKNRSFCSVYSFGIGLQPTHFMNVPDIDHVSFLSVFFLRFSQGAFVCAMAAFIFFHRIF